MVVCGVRVLLWPPPWLVRVAAPFGCSPCRREQVDPFASSSIRQRGPQVSCASMDLSSSCHLESLCVYLVASLTYVLVLLLGFILGACKMLLWSSHDV